MACARAHHPLTVWIFVAVVGMGGCSRSPGSPPSDSSVHVPVDTVDGVSMQRHPEEAFGILRLALVRDTPSYEDTLVSLLNRVLASPGFAEKLMGTLFPRDAGPMLRQACMPQRPGISMRGA